MEISPAPWTCGWLARICSISVVPERGMPTMNTGLVLAAPQPTRDANNASSKVSSRRPTYSENARASKRAAARLISLPRR